MQNILDPHHYAANATDMARVALAGGTDIDCGGALTAALPDAISSGAVAPGDLAEPLTNLFSVRVRLGEFDPPELQPYRSIGADAVCTAASKALAFEAAAQGIVLLKNAGGGDLPHALPFDRTAVRTLALIGPNAGADRASVMQSNYAGTPCPGTLNGLPTTFAAYANVTYVQGCDIAGSSTSGIAAAVAAAAAADAVVIVAGLDLSQESEGLDRTIVAWPGVQAQLIAAVAAAAKGPVVLVIMSGGSIDLTEQLADTHISILWAGYPGEAGGEAIAAAVFGDVVPAGRLAQTIYGAGFPASVSLFDMGMRPGPSAFPPGTNPGRTYRFYTGTPVLPFGFGLRWVTDRAPSLRQCFLCVRVPAEGGGVGGCCQRVDCAKPYIANAPSVAVTRLSRTRLSARRRCRWPRRATTSRRTRTTARRTPRCPPRSRRRSGSM